MSIRGVSVLNGYLLDTNIVSRWHTDHPAILAKIAILPGPSLLFVSPITLGEIWAGHQITASTDEDRRDDCERFVMRMFRHNVKPIDAHTRIYYGDLLAAISQSFPNSQGYDTQEWLTQIGVDVNDLWIASQAVQYNLVLVTSDGMQAIRQAAGKLLDVENWAVP